MLNLLIKPASSLCNLRCGYCFYHDESAHRDVAFKGIMSDETAENVIEKAFAVARRSVLFAFQGGEPTLAGLDFFKKFAAKVKQANRRKIPVSYTLQTNGTVINDEWAQFLRDHRFLVGLSCDGSQKLHDKQRIDANGKNTFECVLKAAELFSRYGVEFNILTVVTREVAKNIARVYGELKRYGFRYLQFIPCLNPLGCEETLPYTLQDDDYLKFLQTLFDLWYTDFKKGKYYSIRYFDNLFFLARGEAAEQCGMQGHCNIQYVVEGNGDVYPCDFYCLDEYLLGNINTASFTDLAASVPAKRFLDTSAGFDEACSSCKGFKLCRSGCRRYKKNGKYLYCEAFKKFYPKFMEKLPEMERILRSGIYQGGNL